MIACKHLPAITEFLKTYFIVAHNLRWSPERPWRCGLCDSGTGPLLACLQCTHLGCWQVGEGGNHAADHPAETGHALSVEVSTGTVYCSVCRVWVWTDGMEAVWREAQQALAPESAVVRGLEAWNRLVLECAEVSAGGTAVGEAAAAAAAGDLVKRHCFAVRGLFNLGNTCFMNCILQALLHTDPLRRYFLTGNGPAPHQAGQCAKNANGQGPCIACEIDSLFCRAYDGRMQPIAPAGMLEALWRYSRDLAGYEQQDAHELFITLRQALHTHLGGGMFNCGCIIHQSFSGVLQSDLACLQCGNVTETLDPFLDVSLDVRSGEGSLDLTECLRRFTREEQLPAGGYICSACHQNHPEVSKRLSFRRVPPILSIHLKRFEHLSTSAKIDVPVRFEEILNLQPYLSAASLNEHEVGRAGGMTMTDSEAAAHVNHEYRLFAVINHVGSLDSGHYTAFVCCRGDWFWVDDACVVACSRADVFASSAYMLFYERIDHRMVAAGPGS